MGLIVSMSRSYFLKHFKYKKYNQIEKGNKIKCLFYIYSKPTFINFVVCDDCNIYKYEFIADRRSFLVRKTNERIIFII